MNVHVREREGDVVLEFCGEDGCIQVSARAFYTAVIMSGEDTVEKTKELLTKPFELLGEDPPEVRVRRSEDPEGTLLNPWVTSSHEEVEFFTFELERGGETLKLSLAVPRGSRGGTSKIKEVINLLKSRLPW